MTGELILSSYTIDKGRSVINDSFSTLADFKSIVITSLTISSIDVTPAAGTQITWNLSLSCNASVTLDANKTLTISNYTDGCHGTLFVTQGGVGSKTLTLTSSASITNYVANGGGGTISLSTTAGQVDKLSFVCRVYGANTYFFWSVEKNYS